MDMPTTLGHKISVRRKQLGLTREELADAIGVTQVAVSQWESGRTKNLKLDHVIALEDALNIKLRWLVENRGPMLAASPMEAYRAALGRRDEAKEHGQKKAWERIAAVFARAAMVVMFTIPPYMVPKAEAGKAFNINKTEYTLINKALKRIIMFVLGFFRISKLTAT